MSEYNLRVKTLNKKKNTVKTMTFCDLCNNDKESLVNEASAIAEDYERQCP